MDAILALNSGVNEAGELARDTMARVDAAMWLADLHPSAQVIMLGRGAGRMRDYALSYDPNQPAPLVEEKSLDTIESAHFAKLDLLEANSWRNVLVATSDYHVRRTEWTFGRVLGEDYDITVHPVASDHPPELLRWMERREQVQLAIARLKLAGLSPDNDQARHRRLSRLRFRSKDNPLARLVEKVDGLTQLKKD